MGRSFSEGLKVATEASNAITLGEDQDVVLVVYGGFCS